jgi:putative phosphonate metabolism protein
MRYALYFAPAADTPWSRFGNTALCRDVRSGEVSPPPPYANGLAGEWLHLTRGPRRYGFHATLKAPFTLAAKYSERELLNAVHWLAGTLAPVDLGALCFAYLGRFLALVPKNDNRELAQLASRCVVHLDRYRAPSSDEDLARRRAAGLTPRQDELLREFGYPYVLDQFQFHFSLSGAVAPDVAQRMETALAAEVEMLSATSPLHLDRLAIFVEPEPGAEFMVLNEFPLRTRR